MPRTKKLIIRYKIYKIYDEFYVFISLEFIDASDLDKKMG